jgi:hypothetical protein
MIRAACGGSECGVVRAQRLHAARAASLADRIAPKRHNLVRPCALRLYTAMTVYRSLLSTTECVYPQATADASAVDDTCTHTHTHTPITHLHNCIMTQLYATSQAVYPPSRSRPIVRDCCDQTRTPLRGEGCSVCVKRQ